MFLHVEDKYPVSSITVHLEDSDLVFARCGKMYVGDMGDWICNIRSRELSVNVTTVTQNEARYSNTQVARAKKAFEFIKTAGYPFEEAVVASAGDGYIINTPVIAEDIRGAFDIRGKTTRQKKPEASSMILSRTIPQSRRYIPTSCM